MPAVRSALVRPAIRDLAIILGVSWLARAAFVAGIGDAHSLDVEYWQGALGAREEGTNPYETGVLNWPPLWLEIIVSLNAIANRVDVSFLSVLRVYLILVESAIVATLYFTLVSVGAVRPAVRRALLVGFALNPVMIILVCQHGNSDVNVGLLVTLACAALIAYRRSRDVVLWLVGCLFLGLGVLAKTTPLVLAPILAPGARLASRTARALGTTLLLLPVTVGLAVIAALVPRATYDHVIQYRPRPGNFGFSGSFQSVSTTTNREQAAAIAALCLAALVLWLWPRVRGGAESATRRYLLMLTLGMAAALAAAELLERLSVDVRSHYAEAFTLGLLLVVVGLGYRLWREPPLSAEALFTLVAVIFMAVVAFGTGYGAHYAPWFLPALVATYVLLDDDWRRLLLVGYVVAAGTYALEYAFVPFLGAFAVPLLGDPAWVGDVGDWLEDDPLHWALVRIPLFAVYLVLVAAGAARARELMTRSSAGSGARTSPPAT
jgi:hypothetical protein